MADSSPDGPLKMYLHRYADKPARLALTRVLSKAGVGMTLEEMRELREAIDLVEEQVAIAPHCEGSHSSTDLKLMVEIKRSAQ